jgi:phage tail sheath protein FI
MVQVNMGSAGVTATEIDISGPLTQEPTGVPACVIGTAKKGPAYVPITVANSKDFFTKFGTTDENMFGPYAVNEWLKNSNAATYLRVLGVGEGKKREADGSVARAGFTVGSELFDDDGSQVENPYANANGIPGRAYFIGAFMSESLGSTILSDAGLQGPSSITPGNTTSVPVLRGVLMAASGVLLTMSSSFGGAGDSDAPESTTVGAPATALGTTVGTVRLLDGSDSKQEFVLFLNGHKGTDAQYPNVITASFDMRAPNYFGNVFNKDPFKVQEAGYYLYTQWDIHPSQATVTGSVLTENAKVAAVNNGLEACAFITTGSLGYNLGNSTTPNFEGFVDRFTHARSPWVISQKFGGSPQNLFRLHALDAGSGVSTSYKISIENITPSNDQTNKYGTFDVVLRRWDDRDTLVVPLEQWRGLNLDPGSDRYISKVIGDTHVYYDFDRNEGSQKLVIDGNYGNSSNYVRVEVDSAVENMDISSVALPFGFRGPGHLVTSGSAPLASSDPESVLTVDTALKRCITPPVPFRKSVVVGTGARAEVNPSLYWGVQFEHNVSTTVSNNSNLKNESIKSFAKFFPDYSVDNMNVFVTDNTGEPDTAAHGIIDSDRFCRNLFTLENVQVVTGSSTLADSSKWKDAVYVRAGNIVANDTNKTKAFSSSDLTVQANRRFAKFTMFMQGGFDGTNIFDRDSSRINNIAVTYDLDHSSRGRENGPSVKSYSKAIDIITHEENVDMQLLAIPGIRHSYITELASDAVRERFDALYIMDVEEYDNDGQLVESSGQDVSVARTSQFFKERSADNNFAAAYFPDVVTTDPVTGTNIVVPPTVAVLGVISQNDRLAQPWYAPAGITRGAAQGVLYPSVRLSKDNMDTLADARINPLVELNPGTGVVVWGQKTLQLANSSLDRINVRRLLIEIRRQVKDVSRSIIFEPNRSATLARFSAAITPRLTRIQSLLGLERFNVVIDSSTTTQQDIENLTIRGNIIVQPKNSIEQVSLEFVAANNI